MSTFPVVVLGLRMLEWVPVDLGRRGVDECAPISLGTFEQHARTFGIRPQGSDRILEIPRRRRNRGEVKDRVERAFDGRWIDDIGIDVLRTGMIGERTGGTPVVDDDDVGILAEEASDEAVTEKPGTARHQGSHRPIPR